MKKQLPLHLLLLVLLCSLLFVSSCGPIAEQETKDDETSDESDTDDPIAEQEEGYTWTLDELGTEVDIHTELQAQYLADDYKSIANYANGTAELSRPKAIRLSWLALPKTEDQPTVEGYIVELSVTPDFSDSNAYHTNYAFFDLYNVYVGTEYYWRVTAELSDGQTSTSPTSTFSTSAVGPRNLYVDGVSNVRDLGGWPTENGGTVKQGMLYRSGRMNQSESSDVVIEITDDGMMTMRETLGIKTEIDIRRIDNNEVGGIVSSPLGDDVAYYSLPMTWSVDNILTGNVQAVKDIFAILADESNYPVVIHCNIGTDRTGLIAFLVNGLAGVSEEDLYRDYLFSNFGRVNGSRDLGGIQGTYVRTIKSYRGATLSEQIKNCLIALGVPEDDINSVIRIMTEE